MIETSELVRPLAAGRTERRVVSFVRRSARMHGPQQRAWDEDRHRYLLPVRRGETSTSVTDVAPIDPTVVFGRSAPLIVEVGPGGGAALVAAARERPEANLLAFEVYRPALAQLVRRLRDADLTNVRLVEGDAVDGIARLLSAGTIAELWTFFPDPWPKARHHKRRLLSPSFADLAAERLEPGGRWRLATDWFDYAVSTRALLDRHPDFENEHHGWSPRPATRPVTRFEQRGLDAGREIFDLAYRRR